MDIGFRQTGYIVAVGPDNIDALRANLADQQAVRVETGEIDHHQVAELWPVAYLDDFAAFGYEPRGGYADAYQTAQAFAVTARTAGVRLHQSAEVKAIRVQGNKLRGVTLADGTEVFAPTVVIAAGLWSSPLLAACGINVPLRTHRGQVILVEPGADAADRVRDVPVLSDLVSLQYVRAEIDSHQTGPSPARHAERIGQLKLRRLLRHHARFQPGYHSGGVDRGANPRRRLQRSRLQDRPRGRRTNRRPGSA